MGGEGSVGILNLFITLILFFKGVFTVIEHANFNLIQLSWLKCMLTTTSVLSLPLRFSSFFKFKLQAFEFIVHSLNLIYCKFLNKLVLYCFSQRCVVLLWNYFFTWNVSSCFIFLFLRFKFFTTISINSFASCDVMQCSLVDRCQRLGKFSALSPQATKFILLSYKSYN